VKKPLKRVAGALIQDQKSGDFFLLKRNDKSPKWAMVTGKIDGQEVIATTSKKLMYFSNCDRKFKKLDDDKVTYYSGCKHIKFIVGDIYIGN